MEDYFKIIVFIVSIIVYIVVKIAKKSSEAREHDHQPDHQPIEGKPKPGSMIENILEKIKEEYETAQEEYAPPPKEKTKDTGRREDYEEVRSFPEDEREHEEEMSDDRDDWEEDDWDESPSRDVEFESESDSAAYSAEREEARYVKPVEPPEIKHKAPEVVNGYEEPDPENGFDISDMSNERLREAIIWSEILAPPLSERE